MHGKLAKLFQHAQFAPSVTLVLLCAILGLIGLALFAMLNFSAVPPYPEASAIVEEESFGQYVGLVALTFDFLTKVIGVLVGVLLLTILLFAVQMYAWSLDRRKLAQWRESGLVVERLEFLSGNRLYLNNTEIELNRAQMHTLRELVNKRRLQEPLHPADLPGDNGTQLIKRLREEMGARLLEKSLIQNRRGKGYWIDIDPARIHDHAEESPTPPEHP